MSNKPKEIIEFIEGIVKLLQKKVESEKKDGASKEAIEHSEGQLYEAQYILEKVWEIATR